MRPTPLSARLLIPVVLWLPTGCANFRGRAAAPVNIDVKVDADELTSPEAWERKAKSFKTRLLSDNRDVAALAALGDLHASRRLDHEAARLYREALALAPRDPELRVRYAKALAASGQKNAALTQLERVHEAHPDFRDGLTLRGQLLRSIGRNADAMAMFEAAWMADPPDAEAGLELARWELARDRPDDAIRLLRLCKIHDAGQFEARRLLARTLEQTNRAEEAIAEWRGLIEAGYPEGEAFVEVAKLERRLGRADEAEYWLATASRTVTDDRRLARWTKSVDAEAVAPRPVDDAEDYRPILSSKRR